MKLWLDDERPAPDGTWALVRTSDQAIEFLTACTERLEEISLDHDLGGEDTSMRVLDWMVEHNVWPRELGIHTANPPARENMIRLANRYAPFDVDIHIRYW